MNGALQEWAAEDLRRSGISLEAALEAGFQEVNTDQVHSMLGFCPSDMPEAYAIPFRDPATGLAMTAPDGKPFVRVKLRSPVRMGEGDAKYLSPRAGGTHVFIPLGAHQAVMAGAPLVITEGEKKALAATLAGIPTYGLTGVFGGQDSATRDIHPDLVPYLKAGLEVTFVLDSDAAINVNIALAAHRFNAAALKTGCRVKVLVLPPNFKGSLIEKAGMDDILVRDGTVRLQEILAGAKPLNGTVAEVYAVWLLRYCEQCKAAGVEVQALAQDIIRKGFYDHVTSATRRVIYKRLESDWPDLVVAIRAAIRTRMEMEFAGVTAPEHGGENIANNSKVKLPGFEQSGKVDSIEGDQVFCFEPGSTYSSRPFFRSHLEKADPASASAVNGAAGGRPRGPTATEMANAFLASPGVSIEGICSFRFHRGQWFQYNGRFYESVQEQDIKGKVMEFLRQHPDYQANATSSTLADLMNQLRAHDAAGIPSTFEAPLRITDDGFEKAPGWCATRSGLINIDALARAINGENLQEDQLAQPLTARLFSTMALDYEFNPDAKCTKFESFLADVLPDRETRELVQMMAGLCLVPDTRFNVFFVLFGPAGTGKSTLLWILHDVIGPRNVCHVPFGKFGDKFSIGMLTEHLVNLIGEGDTELPKDVGMGRVEGLLKDISDGGILPVERKFQEPGKARATARCLLATNSLPTFYDKSEAIWDRMRVLPFEVRIRGAGRENPALRREIVETELPGILNWALHGLAKLRRLKRFPECPRGLELKESHRAQCDHEREFLSEKYDEGSAEEAVKTQDVYFQYQTWMKQRNYYPVSEGRFAKNVERVLPRVRRGRKRDAAGSHHHVWIGMRPHQEAA